MDQIHEWIVLMLQVFDHFVVVDVRDNIRLFFENFLEQDHTQGSYVRISKPIQNILVSGFAIWIGLGFGRFGVLVRHNPLTLC